MGAGQSSGIEIGGSSMGYQVLRVYPNGPGSQAGLKAYFDFIVAIGNTRFNRESGSLREILKASVDQKLKMTVYNTRTKLVRDVEIIPSVSWGGNGLLGVSIKHTSFDRADERVWHVVEVEPNSPAQQAGLKPDEDYVIGADSILQENDDLYNLIEAHDSKALKLFVYNAHSDNCREVICHPNSRWGGKGYMGCEFGHGLLHRIPCGEPQNDNPSVTTPLLQQKPAIFQASTNVGSEKSEIRQSTPYTTNEQTQTTSQTQQGQQPIQTPYQFSQLGNVPPNQTLPPTYAPAPVQPQHSPSIQNQPPPQSQIQEAQKSPPTLSQPPPTSQSFPLAPAQSYQPSQPQSYAPSQPQSYPTPQQQPYPSPQQQAYPTPLQQPYPSPQQQQQPPPPPYHQPQPQPQSYPPPGPQSYGPPPTQAYAPPSSPSYQMTSTQVLPPLPPPPPPPQLPTSSIVFSDLNLETKR